MYRTPIEREIDRRKAITALVDDMPPLRPGVVSQLRGDLLENLTMTPERAQERIAATISAEEKLAMTDLAYALGDHQSLELQRDLVPVMAARAGIGGQAMKDAARSSRLYGVGSLVEAAKACLDRAGIDFAALSRQALLTKAQQSTSDFPILLENLLHKSLLEGYRAHQSTWRLFCREGTVADFRAHGRYRVGSLADLTVTNENGEYPAQAIPDGEKSEITAEDHGAILRVSFQTLINDDLGALRDPSRDLGLAAARTVENKVYALLGENSGLGPTQSDGQPFFHSNRANVGTGAALSAASIEADRVIMASQTDVSGNQYLDLRPRVWVGPISHGGTARTINQSEYDPDAAGALQRPNTVRGLFGEIVDTPRLTGNRYYLFADPEVTPALEVAFLNGNSEPQIEREESFASRGLAFRATLDFGVAAIDGRAAVTNAGEA
ncbi:MAG TPA: hypothetical protein DD491_03890 [Halieaceae bacterium]|nr:hypothetical protein [Halieaceae bacterium]